MAISVTLVRKCHPQVDIDELHAMKTIRLHNQGIRSIDNLEVFTLLEELYLTSNAISVIENVEFLVHLSHLDLAFNKIDGNSLRDSIPNIPSSLKSINLSGNPCCEDDTALQVFQDAHPDLGIIIGEEEVDETLAGAAGNGEDEDEEDDDVGEEDSDRPTLLPNQVLDADEILKSIVERKCRLQSLGGPVGIESSIAALNAESSQAEKQLAEKKRFHGESGTGERTVPSPGRHTGSYDSQNSDARSRIDRLRDDSKKAGDESGDFMAQLRLRARQKREVAFAAK